MFTGIVTHIGKLVAREEMQGDQRLEIAVDGDILQGCSEGDSIAVNGVCLTMVNPGDQRFFADVSLETLDKTTLGALPLNAPLNLELPMRLSDRLGGHLVSGHVDGKARLQSRLQDGRSERFEFVAPPRLARFISEKGSVTLDGVSLTVNTVSDDQFSVNLIPHTLSVTRLGALQAHDMVNIEVDMLARYVERLMQGEST